MIGGLYLVPGLCRKDNPLFNAMMEMTSGEKIHKLLQVV
jgi:hypothetical protein